LFLGGSPRNLGASSKERGEAECNRNSSKVTQNSPRLKKPNGNATHGNLWWETRGKNTLEGKRGREKIPGNSPRQKGIRDNKTREEGKTRDCGRISRGKSTPKLRETGRQRRERQNSTTGEEKGETPLGTFFGGHAEKLLAGVLRDEVGGRPPTPSVDKDEGGG